PDFGFARLQCKPFTPGNLMRSTVSASNLLTGGGALRHPGISLRQTVLFQNRVGLPGRKRLLASSPHPLGQRPIIVRRGQFALFELLVRTFADDPHVQVVWDRRLAERRRDAVQMDGDERRRLDRRRRAPSQWNDLNYMIAERPGETMSS